MDYRILLACLLLGAVSLKGFAQDSGKLTLPQLWDLAASGYPGIEAHKANLRKVQQNEKLVSLQYLPDISLQIQNSVGSQNPANGAFFPLPGLYNTGGGIQGVSDPAANMFGSAVLDWKFFQFGKQKKAEEAARSMTRQAAFRLDAERLALQAETSLAYFQLLYHQKMQHWAQENNQRLETLFRAAKSLSESGLAPGADSLLIKASLKQSEAELNKWQGNREESALVLARWTNVDAKDLATEDDAFLNKELADTFQEKMASAVSHPLITYSKERVNHAEKLKNQASAKVFPSLSLLGGLQVRGYDPMQGETLYETWGNSYNNPTGNYLIGLGLSWNLSALFDVKTEKLSYQEEIHQRTAEAEELALTLGSRQEIAMRQLAQEKEQIENAEQAYAASAEAFRLFEVRYNNGLISIAELLQIQDALQKTEKMRIEAYYQYWTQQVELAESSADFSFLRDTFQ